jgi:hypothetical protein
MTGARALAASRSSASTDLPSVPGVPEPPWPLKGYTKFQLAPGQSARASIPLDARSFSYWSDATNSWQIAPGCDVIGASSARLPSRTVIAQGGASCPAP